VSALVALDHVGFSYPTARRREPFAVPDLSFEIARGEILGLIGPNASGKTTVVRLLSRVLAPDRGCIHLEGEPLARLSRAAVAQRVAVVPQDVPIDFPYVVGDLVLMGRFPHGPGRFFEGAEDRALAAWAMEMTGVASLAAERVGELSGGERQRVMLARALAQRPRLLVLDEPTAHLDLRYQAECVGLVRRLNREAGLTVVLVSHDLNIAAQIADRLLLLSRGAVAAIGPPETVLSEVGLASVYGCPVVVDKHPETRRLTVQIAWPAAEGR
jgi:iron complex transport system ATP-binding protein